MPELPEVETTRRGLAPLVCGATVAAVVVRNRALRQPVTRNLARILTGRRIDQLERRAKYLLFRAGDGTLIVHLGMSGRLWVVAADTPPAAHDHFDLALANGPIVRLRDPRRFGLVLWHAGDPLTHKLLRDIGPEPLSGALSAEWLFRETRARSGAIKNALMDSHLIAGVGNIYANEALFRAGIRPQRQAKSLTRVEAARLVRAVRAVLKAAIRLGGTTLRDYVGADGAAGYFRQKLFVYERAAEPCRICRTKVRHLNQGQRSSYYCPTCQK